MPAPYSRAMPIEFSIATTDELEECNRFYNLQYRRSRTHEQMQWEFERGPHSSLYAIARDEGRLVGTQALIPIDLATPFGGALSAKSEETLVDPEYRGQGIFENLYEFLLPHARSLGIRVIWGFTPAVKPFIRAGFTVPATTSQVVLPIQSGFISRLALSRDVEAGGKSLFHSMGERVLLAAGRVARSADAFVARRTSRRFDIQRGGPELIDEIAATQSETSSAVSVLRSREYMTWRFADNPYAAPRFVVANSAVGVDGWAAYSIGLDGVGYLVDLVVTEHAPNRNALIRRLICGVHESLSEGQATALRGWSVTNNSRDFAVRRQFQRLGGVHLKRGMPMVMKVLDDDFRWLEQPNRWHVTRLFTEGTSG